MLRLHHLRRSSTERAVWQVLRPWDLRRGNQFSKNGEEMWAIGVTLQQQVDMSCASWLAFAASQL